MSEKTIGRRVRALSAILIVLVILLSHAGAARAGCGDGVVDGGEDCDQGALNGGVSCCTVGCTLRGSGEICRTAAGVCDVADTCDGVSAECPTTTAGNLALNGTATQSSNLGLDTTAPLAIDGNTDGNFAHGSVTHTNDPDSWWQVDLGAVYLLDKVNVFNRTDCCSDRLTDFYILVSDVPFAADDLATILAQPGVGAYFQAGTAPSLTQSIGRSGRYVRIQQSNDSVLSLAEVEVIERSDPKATAGTECRASQGLCDLAEVCDGARNDCPADARAASGEVCRPSTDLCDAIETCDGISVGCPADEVFAAGTVCRASAGNCDSEETCDGIAHSCPSDVVVTVGTVCRPRAGFNDVTEVCSGTRGSCPADLPACGDLDPSFGYDGLTFEGSGKDTAGAYAVARQNDGKIVVAGWAYDLDLQGGLVVVRYEDDGQRDPTFGVDGVVFLYAGYPAVAQALVIEPDGQIVVAGTLDYIDFLLTRLNPDGSVDTSFGSGGTARTLMGGDGMAAALVRQSDGKLIAVGYRNVGATNDVVLLRYDADGTLDPTYGSGGMVVTNFGADEMGRAAALQPDGKIVVGIHSASGTRDFALARYDTDGNLDASFGSGGKVIAAGDNDEFLYAIALQPDGKIVAAGKVVTRDVSRFYLVRYDSNGTPDLTFGVDGIVKTSIRGLDDSARALVVLPDGKIVATGGAYTDWGEQGFALARYNSDGTVDPSFGTDGFIVTTITPGSSDLATTILVQPDGKLVVAGWRDDAADLLVARYALSCTSDAFVAYKGAAPSVDTFGMSIAGGNQLPQPWAITLDDFRISGTDDPENFALSKVQSVLLPAAVDAENQVSDPQLRYLRYKTSPASEGIGAPQGGDFPKPAKHLPRTWQLDNQLGTINVTSKKVTATLVPVAVDLVSSPAAPASARHYVCYGVKPTKDDTEQTPAGKLRTDLQGFFGDELADCALDQSGNPSFAGTTMSGRCLLSLGKPVELCNPVSTSEVGAPRTTAATGIDASTATEGDSLLCYKVKVATKISNGGAAERIGVNVGDKVTPKQRKHVAHSVATGNPLYTTPGSQFPYPVLLDTKSQAMACVPTYVMGATAVP